MNTLAYDQDVTAVVDALGRTSTVRIVVEPGDATRYDFMISTLTGQGHAIVALINFGCVRDLPLSGLHYSYVAEKFGITEGSARFVTDFLNAIGKEMGL